MCSADLENMPTCLSICGSFWGHSMVPRWIDHRALFIHHNGCQCQGRRARLAWRLNNSGNKSRNDNKSRRWVLEISWIQVSFCSTMHGFRIRLKNKNPRFSFERPIALSNPPNSNALGSPGAAGGSVLSAPVEPSPELKKAKSIEGRDHSEVFRFFFVVTRSELGNWARKLGSEEGRACTSAAPAVRGCFACHGLSVLQSVSQTG